MGEIIGGEGKIMGGEITKRMEGVKHGRNIICDGEMIFSV